MSSIILLAFIFYCICKFLKEINTFDLKVSEEVHKSNIKYEFMKYIIISSFFYAYINSHPIPIGYFICLISLRYEKDNLAPKTIASHFGLVLYVFLNLYAKH